MPKVAKELSALEVKRLNQPGLYAVGGVTGLHLQVSSGNARSWIMRVMIAGKRRDVGLGGYPTVQLGTAREKARALREQTAAGIDPVEAKRTAQRALMAKRAAMISFEECAERFILSKSVEWKNPKHRQQWLNTLATYAYPVIGALAASEIELAHIVKILEPIWNSKPETASRLRGRLESVLSWATVHGFRAGENPARWRGHLDKILAGRGRSFQLANSFNDR